MNPGLDYEKLKQESDELDGLKGIADFTFDFLSIYHPISRSSVWPIKANGQVLPFATECGYLVTMTWLFSPEIKSRLKAKEVKKNDMQAKKLKKLESKAQSLRDKKKNKGNRKLGGGGKVEKGGKGGKGQKGGSGKGGKAHGKK